MNTPHKLHFRAVFYVGVKDVETAMSVSEEIQRMFMALDPDDPDVRVLSMEERSDMPDPWLCPRCSRDWENCECRYDTPEEEP